MQGYQLAMRVGLVFHAHLSSEGINPFEHLHLWVRENREKQTRVERVELGGCALLLCEIKCSFPRAALSFNFTYSL